MKPYSESRWRNHAAPIISRVLTENAGKSEQEIRQALRDAYPFGMRKYHPYQIWLDEIKKQRKTPVRFRVYNPGEKIVFPNAPIGGAA